MQDRFLHVHAIFGLIENHGLRAIENFRSDFIAAMRGKAVHEDSVRRGERHELCVHLIRLENFIAHFFFASKPMLVQESV